MEKRGKDSLLLRSFPCPYLPEISDLSILVSLGQQHAISQAGNNGVLTFHFKENPLRQDPPSGSHEFSHTV